MWSIRQGAASSIGRSVVWPRSDDYITLIVPDGQGLNVLAGCVAAVGTLQGEIDYTPSGFGKPAAISWTVQLGQSPNTWWGEFAALLQVELSLNVLRFVFLGPRWQAEERER